MWPAIHNGFGISYYASLLSISVAYSVSFFSNHSFHIENVCFVFDGWFSVMTSRCCFLWWRHVLVFCDDVTLWFSVMTSRCGFLWWRHVVVFCDDGTLWRVENCWQFVVYSLLGHVPLAYEFQRVNSNRFISSIYSRLISLFISLCSFLFVHFSLFISLCSFGYFWVFLHFFC